tara:strand:+ start:46642 stop:47532 length:891 start_codon:yes stop_codon:yes gene_type:complete
MQILRTAAIEARLRLTAPIRRQQLQQLCQDGGAPMSVLFYHRVADTHPNDWTISRDEFKRHVDYCCEHFRLVGLDEVQRRAASNFSADPTVTFTFDDGYAENVEFALPYLAENNVPCVYFVTVGNVQNQTPFPHDVQAGTPLAVNTAGQLREAAELGIEIGLHTATHVDFATADDPQTLQREVHDAKDALEQMIGRAVRYFAVPFGLPEQLTPNVVSAAQKAGLSGFCSAYGAYNFPGQDAFHLRRIHGDPDFARLRNWLTYDARKVKIQPIVPPCVPLAGVLNPVPVNTPLTITD